MILTYLGRVLHRFRFAMRPGWLALHGATAGLVTTMVLLGRWQLRVSNEKGFSLQNFGYAVQWWLFSVFVLAMWVRALRDHGRRDIAPTDRAAAELEAIAEGPVAYRRYVMPQLSSMPATPVDAEHAAYNDYLSRLAAKDAGDQA